MLTHWKNAKFDDFDVNTSAIPCAEARNRWDDYERVKAFLDSPLNSIHVYNDISKEYQSMFKHIDRYANEIVFTKCTDHECCSEWSSKNFAFLSKYNMKLFAPTKSEKYVSYFNSFLQACTNNNNEFRSSGQTSVEEKNLGKCDHCPEYHFKLKTEKKRHISVFHRRRKTPASNNKSHHCNVCGKKFNSLSTLNRHKLNSSHNKRKQPEPSNEKQKVTKRQRTINNMLREMRDISGK